MAKIMLCIKRLNPHLLPNFRYREAFGRLRQAIALPLYTASLILSFVSDALGKLAARIAGDHWPL